MPFPPHPMPFPPLKCQVGFCVFWGGWAPLARHCFTSNNFLQEGETTALSFLFARKVSLLIRWVWCSYKNWKSATKEQTLSASVGGAHPLGREDLASGMRTRLFGTSYGLLHPEFTFLLKPSRPGRDQKTKQRRRLHLLLFPLGNKTKASLWYRVL